LIERTPRHTRTRRHMRHSRTRITQLIHHTQRRREQPRTLNLHHPRTGGLRKKPRTHNNSRLRAGANRNTRRHHAAPPTRRLRTQRDPAARPEALLGQERERERERCVSAADASTYGPKRARSNPQHVCPKRTHAKTAPS